MPRRKFKSMSKRIFPEKITIDELNNFRKGAMSEHLDIVYVDVGDDFIKATMPVDHRTKQPYGLLHGGASLVLAEELGSIAANLTVNNQEKICVGLDINANHIKSVRNGRVTGEAKPVKLGNRIQVWEIKIYDEQNDLTCISRLTVAVLERNKNE